MRLFLVWLRFWSSLTQSLLIQYYWVCVYRWIHRNLAGMEARLDFTDNRNQCWKSSSHGNPLDLAPSSSFCSKLSQLYATKTNCWYWNISLLNFAIFCFLPKINIEPETCEYRYITNFYLTLICMNPVTLSLCQWAILFYWV